jgi:hypothetical protein
MGTEIITETAKTALHTRLFRGRSQGPPPLYSALLSSATLLRPASRRASPLAKGGSISTVMVVLQRAHSPSAMGTVRSYYLRRWFTYVPNSYPSRVSSPGPSAHLATSLTGASEKKGRRLVVAFLPLSFEARQLLLPSCPPPTPTHAFCRHFITLLAAKNP